MYTGDLNEANGIPVLLRAFRLVGDPSVRLWFLGRGECECAVTGASHDDPRIAWLGFRPNEEVRNLQRIAALLINARPADHEVARYTFPSKLLEYMQSGTPVLTTRLPGIPDEYYEHVFPLEQEAEGIAEALGRILSFLNPDCGRKAMRHDSLF